MSPYVVHSNAAGIADIKCGFIAHVSSTVTSQWVWRDFRCPCWGKNHRSFTIDKELTAETNSSRSFQKQNNHLSSLGCSTVHQGSVGICAPHVGHSTYLYPTFNLHISYFSWNYFVCVSGRSQQPEPSGPSRKVPDLLLSCSSPPLPAHLATDLYAS